MDALKENVEKLIKLTQDIDTIKQKRSSLLKLAASSNTGYAVYCKIKTDYRHWGESEPSLYELRQEWKALSKEIQQHYNDIAGHEEDLLALDNLEEEYKQVLQEHKKAKADVKQFFKPTGKPINFENPGKISIYEQITKIIKEDDIEKFEDLACVLDLDGYNHEHLYTFAQIASLYGSIKILTYMTENGFNLFSTLPRAKNLETVKLLIEKGNIDPKSQDGFFVNNLASIIKNN